MSKSLYFFIKVDPSVNWGTALLPKQTLQGPHACWLTDGDKASKNDYEVSRNCTETTIS